MAESGTGFGEVLRHEREVRGVSLETLSAETKVNPRHFAALEQEDYRNLPGGVFRRGIVRAYLSSVGLDQGVWMPRFQASYDAHAQAAGQAAGQEEEGWATFATNVKKNRSRPEPKFGLRWLGVAGLFLLLAGAAWFVWHFVLRSRLQP